MKAFLKLRNIFILSTASTQKSPFTRACQLLQSYTEYKMSHYVSSYRICCGLAGQGSESSIVNSLVRGELSGNEKISVWEKKKRKQTKNPPKSHTTIQTTTTHIFREVRNFVKCFLCLSLDAKLLTRGLEKGTGCAEAAWHLQSPIYGSKI